MAESDHFYFIDAVELPLKISTLDRGEESGAFNRMWLNFLRQKIVVHAELCI